MVNYISLGIVRQSGRSTRWIWNCSCSQPLESFCSKKSFLFFSSLEKYRLYNLKLNWTFFLSTLWSFCKIHYHATNTIVCDKLISLSALAIDCNRCWVSLLSREHELDGLPWFNQALVESRLGCSLHPLPSNQPHFNAASKLFINKFILWICFNRM